MTKSSYIRDLGKKQENQQMRLNVDMDQQYSLNIGQAHQLNIYDMSTSNVKYHDVDSYQSLLNVMKSL